MASKADQVYDWIRDNIMSGQAVPRDPLNADEISRTLGVSKIPIREALQRLTAEGLVTYRQYSGAVVAPLSWRELSGIRTARGALEPAAARIGAERRTDEQLDQLRAQVQVLSDQLALGQLHRFLETNLDFHLALADCAGLPLLTELINITLRKVNRYRAVLPASLELATSDLEEHRLIVAAFEAGDADLAEQRVRDHVTGEHTIAADAQRIKPTLFDDIPTDAIP